MNDFETELCTKIIERLSLDDVEVDDITPETALFGEGLELDSIDALEIEAMVAEEWGINIHPSERSGATFASMGTLAQFIVDNKRRDIPAS